MVLKLGDHSPEVIARAKELYISDHNMSLAKLAKNSAQLVGQAIPLDKLKDLSSRDGWHLQKSKTAPDGSNLSQEVDDIRQIVYNAIIADSRDGIFITGDFDKANVIELLESIPGLVIESISPHVEPQLVNSYMNLLAKSNAKIDTGVSGKTSREDAIAIARQEIQKARTNGSGT